MSKFNKLNANSNIITHTLLLYTSLGHAPLSELLALIDIMEISVLTLNSVRLSDLFSV